MMAASKSICAAFSKAEPLAFECHVNEANFGMVSIPITDGLPSYPFVKAHVKELVTDTNIYISIACVSHDNFGGWSIFGCHVSTNSKK